MNLLNKVVVITGATGGIGTALAEAFDKAKARLILISKREERLKELISTLEGKEHQFIPFDFRISDNIPDLLKQIRDKCKNVDVLINNAGIGVYKPFESI